MSKKESDTVKPELIRKITGKVVMDGIKIPTDKSSELYHIYGVVRGYKTLTSDLGDYLKFRGDFLAIRLSDGKEFESVYCILQQPFDVTIANEYDKASNDIPNDNKKAAIDMAVSIGTKPADTPTGYMWVLESLIPMQTNNAIEGIRSRVKHLGK